MADENRDIHDKESVRIDDHQFIETTDSSYLEIILKQNDSAASASDSISNAPNLLSPINNQQLSNTTVKFVWNNVKNAAKYNFHIGLDTSLFPHTTGSTSMDTSTVIICTGNNIPYYWMVRGINNEGQSGPWSEIRSFIILASGIEIEQDVPIRMAPNPTTSYTHIYGRENTVMSISIRNPLGVEVMNTVTNGALDTHLLSSGVYFVTITANGKSQTLKLIKE